VVINHTVVDFVMGELKILIFAQNKRKMNCFSSICA